MQFPDRIDVVAFILQIFRRLYNSFPNFRKNLEDPIISCLYNVIKLFKAEIEKAKRIIVSSGEDILSIIDKDIIGKEGKPAINLGKDYQEAKNLFITA